MPSPCSVRAQGTVQVCVTLHDISEQKRVSNIHRARFHLMQFASSHTLEELLVETLDELEKLTGSSISFYHFYEADTQRVTLKQWSTRTTARFCRDEGKGRPLQHRTGRSLGRVHPTGNRPFTMTMPPCSSGAVCRTAMPR